MLHYPTHTPSSLRHCCVHFESGMLSCGTQIKCAPCLMSGGAVVFVKKFIVNFSFFFVLFCFLRWEVFCTLFFFFFGLKSGCFLCFHQPVLFFLLSFSFFLPPSIKKCIFDKNCLVRLLVNIKMKRWYPACKEERTDSQLCWEAVFLCFIFFGGQTWPGSVTFETLPLTRERLE